MVDTVHTGENVRGQAREMWDDAKESARSRLDEEKQSAAAGMDDVAHALRDAAQRRGEGQDNFARLSSSAADGLERLSETLRNKDVSSMLRDVDNFARSQPMAFFGLAVVAGFVGVRMIKASQH